MTPVTDSEKIIMIRKIIENCDENLRVYFESNPFSREVDANRIKSVRYGDAIQQIKSKIL